MIDIESRRKIKKKCGRWKIEEGKGRRKHRMKNKEIKIKNKERRIKTKELRREDDE